MYVIRAGELEVHVNPSLGGEIARVRSHGHDLLASYDWLSPVGVSHSSTYGDERLDWLSDYRGGWQLLVPNAGLACTVDGVRLPFHGEWSRTQVEVIERGPAHVVMRAGTRLPLTVERAVQAKTGPECVLVHTTVSNEGTAPVPFVWTEHPAFAVGPGDQIDFPSADVHDGDGVHVGYWPRLANARDLSRVDPSAPSESVHFLAGFDSGWAAIRRPRVGVALAWDTADFPCAWLWHEIASPGFPFFGRTSLVAIEPSASWPGTGLAGAVTNGRAMKLEPGQSRSTTVALIPFAPDGRAVSHASVSGHVEFAPA